MTIEMTDSEKEIETQQVEQVFGLGGGELDRPWVTDYATLPYNYEGAPEYATRDFPETEGDVLLIYRTVVSPVAHALPAFLANGTELDDHWALGLWARVGSFSSSGECECVFHQCDPEDVPEMNDRPCAYCDAQEGEKHGHIYLGDGWGEVIYAHAYRFCDLCGDRHIDPVGPCICGPCAIEAMNEADDAT